MIELNNVSFSYGKKKVLDGFSLIVPKGDRICLFGESGAGKTTILRLILGLEKADLGTVKCNGSFSAVFQEDRLLPFKTVKENITAFTNSNKIDIILNRLGIGEYSNSYPSELSGGIARRAAIARALCIDADAYVFDEPFTGLDSANVALAAELINEITSEKTVILVTHSKSDAQMLNCKITEI